MAQQYNHVFIIDSFFFFIKFPDLFTCREVRDGTMLKLVDSDTLTTSTVRRSRSAHSSLSNDSHYYSEPEFDADPLSTSELPDKIGVCV